MAKNTKIEWAHHTFNPWIGCTKISPGCEHCYAEAWAKRTNLVKWGNAQPRHKTSETNWKQPLKWDKEAQCLGIRYRVFCASLADVFDNEVPPEWREELFKLIADTPNLDWLIVTKRIGNVDSMIKSFNKPCLFYERIWLLATICNQQEADRDIPKLLKLPFGIRGLSMEPLLGPVEISQWLKPRSQTNQDGYHGDHAPGWTTDTNTLDWIIVGGESGPHARPMQHQWVTDLRDECQTKHILFFFKQWGEYGYLLQEDRMSNHRIGKKLSGRELDGKHHDEFPQ